MSLPQQSSVVSTGLADYPTVYYERKAFSTLYSNLWMYPACDLRIMPNMSGVAMQIFDYTSFGANTTPATEGTPGSGQALTQNKATLNLSNYVDYISYSSKVVLTTISNTVAEGSELLSFRGAISIDTVISNAVDTQCAANSANDDIIVGGGGGDAPGTLAYMSAAISREAYWQLRAQNCHPKDNGQMFGIINSLNGYDLVNDASAGGTLDLQKYAETLAPNNPALVGIKGSRIGIVGGVEWFESNALTSETGFGSPASTAYHSYVFAKDAFAAASLGKTELGQKNFTVRTANFPIGTNSLDPASLIAAASVYNVWFGVVAVPQVVAGQDRVRRIRAEASIIV